MNPFPFDGEGRVPPGTGFGRKTWSFLVLGELGRPHQALEPWHASLADAERFSIAWLTRPKELLLYAAKPMYLRAARPEVGRFLMAGVLEALERHAASEWLAAAAHFAERAACPVLFGARPSLVQALLGETDPDLQRLREHSGARWLYLTPDTVTAGGRHAPNVAPLLGVIAASCLRDRCPFNIVGLETGGAIDAARFELDLVVSTTDDWHRLAEAGIAAPIRAPDGRAYYPALPSFARRRRSADLDPARRAPASLHRELPRTLFCSEVVSSGWERLTREQRDSPTQEILEGAFSAPVVTSTDPARPSDVRADVSVRPHVGADREELAVELRLRLDGGHDEESTDEPLSVRLCVDTLPKHRGRWEQVFSRDRRRTLRSFDVEREDLSATNLYGLALPNSSFRECAFDGAHLTYSDFADVRMLRCAGRGANLARNKLYNSRWADCQFTESSFFRAKFVGARIERCSFARSSFAQAFLLRATVSDTSFAGADLEELALTGAVFQSCDFRGATPDPRTLANDASFQDCLFDDTTASERVRARILHPATPGHRFGREEPWELPFRLLYIDDFTHAEDGRPVEDRSPIRIDKGAPARRGQPAPLEGSTLGRALSRAVEEVEANASIKIEMVNASKEDLRRDYEDAPELRKSGLFRMLYSGVFGGAGGEPYGAIVLGHSFDASGSDRVLLRKIVETTALAHAPVIVSPEAIAASSDIGALRASPSGCYLGCGDPGRVGQVLVKSFLETGFPGGVEGVDPLRWVASRVMQCLKIRDRYERPRGRPAAKCAFHNAWLATLVSAAEDGMYPFREAWIRDVAVGQCAVDILLQLATHAAPGVPRGVVVVGGELDIE